MITGLSSSIGGPLQYLQAKPRVLLFRARAAADDTSAALQRGPAALPAGTAVNGAALAAGEDDLATFLVPRILRAASSLQAALLTSAAPRTDVLQTATTRLWRERAALLAQLENMLATMVGILAESGVRLDWQGPDGTPQGGLGKAREMVTEMIKLLRGTSLFVGTPIQKLTRRSRRSRLFGPCSSPSPPSHCAPLRFSP